MCGESSQGIKNDPMILLVSLLEHFPCSHRQLPIPSSPLSHTWTEGKETNNPTETQEGVSVGSAGLTGPWQCL